MNLTGIHPLKIKEIDTIPLNIPFLRPHKISLGASQGRSILVVIIRTDSGLTGLGEAIAHPAFSGETLEALQGGINYLSQFIVDENPRNLNRINSIMDAQLYGNYGAKSAIEMALFDIVGKLVQLPVYDLLGGKLQEKLPLSRSASQSNLEKDVDEVKKYLSEGYRIIKVKVGVLPVHEDIERVKAIRETTGPAVSLRADANQGWDVPTALKFLKGVKDCDLEFLEQPLPRWDLDGLAYLRSQALTPIMADEAVTTEHDVLNLVKRNAADFISIKVVKSGGIMKCRKIAYLANSAGIKCYLGSQCETSIATSASLHYALSTDGFEYGGEIYGPKFFVKDIAQKPVRIEGGFIFPSGSPGLGIELDMDVVKEFRIQK